MECECYRAGPGVRAEPITGDGKRETRRETLANVNVSRLPSPVSRFQLRSQFGEDFSDWFSYHDRGLGISPGFSFVYDPDGILVQIDEGPPAS